MKKIKDLKTKDKILHNAIQEFIENGYHGARMQRIAERAKVNKALIFYYFSSKELIYKEVISTVINTVMDRLNKIDNKPASVREKIGQIVDTYMEVFLKYPDYVKLMQYEMVRGGPNIRKFNIFQADNVPFNPVTGTLYKYFEEKIKSGEIRKVDVFQLLLSIIGQILIVFFARPVMEIMREKYTFDIDNFMEQRKEFIVNLVMEGIGAKKC